MPLPLPIVAIGGDAVFDASDSPRHLPSGVPVDTFRKQVVDWYLVNGRRLPWRTRDLTRWQWLLVELCLRRSRAEHVELIFGNLVDKYPRPDSVMLAPSRGLTDDLRRIGLVNQRVAAIKAIAGLVTNLHGGEVPGRETILRFPHVGPYIANAVGCFCDGECLPIVDVNVARVIARVFGESPPLDARRRWIWRLAQKLLPETQYREYNYGLLDVGALICRPRRPRCLECPLESCCSTYLDGGFDPI